jgi:uncharacterized protein (DUF2126 family)/transglutaminase-like putative cysteine protease
MSIQVALRHKTSYRYDRPISLGPQIIRLRPAVHCRTPIKSYSLTVGPADHFLNWQQDPHGNYLARCVFNEKSDQLQVEVDLTANLASVNPFDFFLEPTAETFPFHYAAEEADDLKPYFAQEAAADIFRQFLDTVDRRPRKTIDFLVDINQLLQRHIEYVVRLEPGIQTPEQTLTLRRGSCRDSAWLLVQLLRHLGFAARFVSGYLIQLVADVKPLEGPAGPPSDFTDLHAWTEVYLPGAGWVGLDPTSGLLAGEGHLPLACTPQPQAAAPITGALEKCEVQFDVEMSVARIHEDPRVTKPYTQQQWERILALGSEVDRRLIAGDVRLTMGGEPTFVSVDDMDGDEWQTAAVGPTKKRFAEELLRRLQGRFAPGGLLHYGQGKWYPGEQLPRWAMHCLWRKDGTSLWRNPQRLAHPEANLGHDCQLAQRFAQALANRLGVDHHHAILGYEDAMYYAWRERRLPANVSIGDSKLEDPLERERLARIFEHGITSPVGVALPIQFRWWESKPRWYSGEWIVRSDEMFLLPGDSAMGYRLPLQSLLYTGANGKLTDFFEPDPFRDVHTASSRTVPHFTRDPVAAPHQVLRQVSRQPVAVASGEHSTSEPLPGSEAGPLASDGAWLTGSTYNPPVEDRSTVIRSALCVESRHGLLHVFLPPIDRPEVYFDLIAAVEDTCEALDVEIVVEGYLPPHDPQLETMKVTPDPGVLEVNVHPAGSWDELVEITSGVYEDAHQTRLGTEKFDLDGTHTGTGGGNHVVMGGPTPADSPWLRRPDLLKSFLTYWHNHPSLSYLFSGKFIGPTSQAPRVDESRADALYELKIACEQIAPGRDVPPWLVDRIFRNLLVDSDGNTHRAEFCIDKLFSPDSATGRLGLVEFRAFEMPPHPRMSLTQQLLLRALTARFWERPYQQAMVDWNTTLHDRWMLPHFIWQDFEDVIDETRAAGIAIEAQWFDAHFEFRFPFIGEFTQRGVHVELRRAIEPWYVLGEEPGGGAMARYVDSSVERMQVKVRGMTRPRYELTCNRRRIPLHPTGVRGEYVAGVRYRAWQPPSCLHPLLGIDSPLQFDLADTWLGRSAGGCQYHVGHPGGLNPATFPINALEAESRRATRFFDFGHTPGPCKIPLETVSPEFPLTLDLRRGKQLS